MLYSRKGSRFLWYRFQIAGREFRGSTNETNRARALRVEATRRDEERKRAPTVRAARGLGGLRAMSIEDVKDAENRRLNKGQIGMIRWIWRAIDSHFGASATVRDIDFDSVSGYVAFRKSLGIRGQSIRREVSALRRVCQRAAHRGWIGQVPARWPTVKSDPPDEQRSGKLHPSEKIRAVLDLLPHDVRDEYEFAALTGLRMGELGRVELNWMEQNASGPILRVPAKASKTKRERIIALSAPAVAILERRGSLAPVFACLNYARRLRAASDKCGLTMRVTRRDLRTYFATVGLAGSGDAAAVQASMGHSDLRMTQRYQRTTIDRAAKVSEAAAAGLRAPKGKLARKGRHMSTSDEKHDAISDERLRPWQAELIRHADLGCAECAELRRLASEHVSDRHMSVGTGRLDRRAA